MLLIHASIWLYQFLRVSKLASRKNPSSSYTDEQLVIVGFFHRVLKLLYFNIHPILVFDGKSKPYLKNVTLRERSKQAEKSRNSIKKFLNRIAKNELLLNLSNNKSHEIEEPIQKEIPRVEQFEDFRLENDSKDENEIEILSVISSSEEDRDFLQIEPFSEAFTALSLDMQQKLLIYYAKHHEILFDVDDPSVVNFSKLQIKSMAAKGKYLKALHDIKAKVGNDELFGLNRVASNPALQYMFVKKNEDFGWTLGPSTDSPSSKSEDELEEVEIRTIHSDTIDFDDSGASGTEGEMLSKKLPSIEEDTFTKEASFIPSSLRVKERKAFEFDTTTHKESSTLEFLSHFQHFEPNIKEEIEVSDGSEIVTDLETGLPNSLLPDEEEIKGHQPSPIIRRGFLNNEAHYIHPIKAVVPIHEPGVSSSTEDAGFSADDVQSESEIVDMSKEIDDPEALKAQLGQFREDLSKEQSRIASFDEDMMNNIKELLNILGIPFITSPLEAEAQCAFLCSSGFVDGIITEDSDVFLYFKEFSLLSKQSVYRNVFKHDQFVERYKIVELTSQLGLSRTKMLFLTYLLGSDYNTGLHGIGVVHALEIVGMFEDIDEFAHWFNATKVNHDDNKERAHLRKKLNNIIAELPVNFPDKRVEASFQNPVVHSNIAKEELLPRPIHMESLIKYVKAKIGWSAEKIGRIMMPILKSTHRKQHTQQPTLDVYFRESQSGSNKKRKPSKRFSNALMKIKKTQSK